MKLRLLLVVISSLLILSSCETIKKKSDSVAKEENDKFGKFVGEHIEELKIELGSSTEDYLNEKGNKVFVYKSKKYGITCERKFEIDQSKMIIGVSSRGCF